MGRNVGTLLILSSLREALLTDFLRQNLVVKRCDPMLIKRLFDDKRLAGQKFNKLFPSAVGLKWESAVKILSNKHSMDYFGVSFLMEEVAKARNSFLHEGSPWQIAQDLPERCINSLFEWMLLFVHLHNEYTQPFWGAY